MQNKLNYLTPWTEVIQWAPEAVILQGSTDYNGVGLHNPNGDILDFNWGD